MLGDAATWVAAFLFGLWFLLSVIGQLDTELVDRLRSRDPLGLIPRWTFFAPIPGTSDYHLLYRELRDELLPGGWVEVPFVRQRRWVHAIWNPARRRGKVLNDSVNFIAREAERARKVGAEDEFKRQVAVSIPYLVILHNVMRHDVRSCPTQARRQFVVVERRSQPSQIKVVLSSTFHRVRQLR